MGAAYANVCRKESILPQHGQHREAQAFLRCTKETVCILHS